MREFLSFILDLILPPKQSVRVAESTGLETLTSKLTRPHLPFPDTQVLFSYRDPLIRSLVWALKYHGSERAAHLFAEFLADEIVEEAEDIYRISGQKPLLIPLPLSANRLKERGFNQTEILAREMLKIIPEIAELRTDILIKIKETKRQTEILRKDLRRKNIVGAFRASNHSPIAGRMVILLDDVITTGSTLGEARRVLLEAGARRVVGMAIAH